MKHIALVLLAATPFSAAFATEAPDEALTGTADRPPIEASNSPSPGYRISDISGFRLVEHGHWAPQPGEEATDPTAKDGTKTGLTATHYQPVRKKLATNFRRAAFLPHVYAAEIRFGLPAGLLDALIWTESRYNPLAISHAGAGGLGQLMPATAKELGVTNRFDPYTNIIGAARYLRQMLDRFGVVHLALAAYNAGPGAVSRVRGIPFNGETPGYVRSVLDRWAAI